MGGEELYFVQIIWFDMKESFVNYKGNEDPKVLDDPKISEEIMDFFDPKVFGDTFIFDGLVFFYNCILLKEHHHIDLILTFPLRSYPRQTNVCNLWTVTDVVLTISS